MAELMGPQTEATLVHDCAGSVSGAMCPFDHIRGPWCNGWIGLDVHDPATIEHLADHVVRFSLGGIRALAGRPQRGPQEVHPTFSSER